MNKALRTRRFNIAANVMRRVARGSYNFNMGTWLLLSEKQAQYFREKSGIEKMTTVITDKILVNTVTNVVNEQSAQECGTAACFSGWLGLSEEARAEGAKTSFGGLTINGKQGAEGIAAFLGISLFEAEHLVYPAHYGCLRNDNPNAYDVLNRLHRIAERHEVDIDD